MTAEPLTDEDDTGLSLIVFGALAASDADAAMRLLRTAPDLARTLRAMVTSMVVKAAQGVAAGSD